VSKSSKTTLNFQLDKELLERFRSHSQQQDISMAKLLVREIEKMLAGDAEVADETNTLTLTQGVEEQIETVVDRQLADIREDLTTVKKAIQELARLAGFNPPKNW
jgi:AraC-like DNA-binding protein